jgi:hypothetical protein
VDLATLKSWREGVKVQWEYTINFQRAQMRALDKDSYVVAVASAHLYVSPPRPPHSQRHTHHLQPYQLDALLLVKGVATEKKTTHHWSAPRGKWVSTTLLSAHPTRLQPLISKKWHDTVWEPEIGRCVHPASRRRADFLPVGCAASTSSRAA